MQYLFEIIRNPLILLNDNTLKVDKRFLRFSFAFSAFALFNWRLGASIVSEKSFNFFLFDLLLHIFFLWAFQIFYVPVIHLFIEKPAAQIKPFIAYFNFSMAILITLLPISIILYAMLGGLKSVLFFYGLSISSMIYIYHRALKGLKTNYELSSFSAILYTILPATLFLLFLAAQMLLTLGIVFHN